MKVLISITLFGAVLAQLCNAQAMTCTTAVIDSLLLTFNMCDSECFTNICDCCTQALAAGSSDSNHNCCSAYSKLLQCVESTASAAVPTGVLPCDALAGDGNGDSNGDSNGESGASMATAIGVMSGMMILASSAINQLIL